MKTNLIFTLSIVMIVLVSSGCSAAPGPALQTSSIPVEPISVIQAVSLPIVPQPTALPEVQPTPTVVVEDPRPNPRYYGAHLDIIPEAGFGVWLPEGWTHVELDPGLVGAQYLPNLDDPLTFLRVERVTRPAPVQPADKEALHQTMTDELESLPNYKLESEETWAGVHTILLDARYTYEQAGSLQKRWLRWVFMGREQLIITAQGKDAAEYDYWLPMFFNMIMTLQVIPAE